MNPRLAFNVLVGVAAVVAIALVAGVGLPGGGGDDDDERKAADSSPPPGDRTRDGPADEERAEPPTRTAEEERPPAPKLPANPDEVKGSQEISLHHPANLRRALRVLEAERRRSEGVFDGLRVAPGRIDTTIETPDKRIHMQIRPDFKVSFRSESDFPNANDPRFRKRGLGAGAVDVTLPSRLLRRIDRRRSGSAARDLDYFVIRRDIIDFRVNYGAYLRSGTRPRIFLLEPGKPFRAIG